MNASFPSRGYVSFFLILLSAVCLNDVCVAAQQGIPHQAMPAASSADVADDSPQIGKGRILLVLPFDNLTDASSQNAQPNNQGSAMAGNSAVGNGAGGNSTASTNEQASLDWLREAAPEVLNSRFTSAGFFPLSREDRLYALDHLGLPEGFQPSRATALRLAQTLDADYILIGSYQVNGGNLLLKARIVNVAKLRISEEVTESGPIAQLIPLLSSLAWQLTRKLDPSFGVAEETFRAAGSKVHVDAFEQYIRGLTEHDTTDRLRHLKKATDLNPNFTDAWLAMARVQFQNQMYEQAAVSFGKVARGDPAGLEAGFYRGLSLMFSGNYPRAEEAFASVARVLPLPEVVNNQGVAMSRRGHDAIALFRQAVAADPTDADYHFNLAVSLRAHGDNAEALKELGQSLKLHPNDSEAKAAEEAWKKTPLTPAAQIDGTPVDKAGNEKPVPQCAAVAPLERIKRSYNGAAFRQAGLMLDQVEAARLAALPKTERAVRLSKTAHDKLDRGLLLEAEREYNAALAADDRSAEAHAGLAEVRERAGDADDARKEALASNLRKPNLEAYLVLARLDLGANHLPEARDEAAEAVKLDSSSRAAKDLRKAIDSRMDSHAVTDSKAAAPVQPSLPIKP